MHDLALYEISFNAPGISSYIFGAYSEDEAWGRYCVYFQGADWLHRSKHSIIKHLITHGFIFAIVE